jgi:hypothetical protein
MFWAGDDLFRLTSYLDMNYVGFAASLMNHAHPAMVASVRHSLMNGRFDQDSDFLPWLIGSQYPAQPYLSSLPRPLAEKGPRSRPVTLRTSHQEAPTLNFR